MSRSQWIMLDLGAQFDDIYAVEIVLIKPAPPSPPGGPPPQPPPLPNNPPFPSPAPPKPSPPPPSPPVMPPVACAGVNNDFCDGAGGLINSVYHSNNGICALAIFEPPPPRTLVVYTHACSAWRNSTRRCADNPFPNDLGQFWRPMDSNSASKGMRSDFCLFVNSPIGLSFCS